MILGIRLKELFYLFFYDGLKLYVRSLCSFFYGNRALCCVYVYLAGKYVLPY